MPKSDDHPSTCEVAVTEDGKVVVNYQCEWPACKKWGHLTFNQEQIKEFIGVLQSAAIQARHKRAARN